MLRAWLVITLLAGVFLSGGGWAEAGKFNKKLNLGDAAPGWSKLPGVDQKEHSLADYAAKYLVVVFTCNQCPVAVGYEQRFSQFAKKYQDREVQLVAINVNGGKSESLARMTKRSADEHFAFDYLKDESQATAKAYGARTTPTVFLLDAQRKIIYMGAFDDNWEAVEAVEHHYLIDAVEAALAGKIATTAETQATGCGIPYGSEEE